MMEKTYARGGRAACAPLVPVVAFASIDFILIVVVVLSSLSRLVGSDNAILDVVGCDDDCDSGAGRHCHKVTGFPSSRACYSSGSQMSICDSWFSSPSPIKS